MNEIEEKYRRFTIDENMRDMFSNSSVDIEDKSHKKTSFVITTVVIDSAGKSAKPKEKKNAKLV